MGVFFFDSSGAVKHYVSEAGSGWVGGLVDPAAGHLRYLAEIAGVEVISAIARRSRSGTLLAPTAAAALTRFRQDFATEFLTVPITTLLIADAMQLAERYSLRGYDAVQLAAALQVADECRAAGTPFVLISADRELNAAAVAEGLAVDDPNDHP